MKTVKLYHGNYLFEKTETKLNVSPDYVQAQLAREYERQVENGSLDPVEVFWGTIEAPGEQEKFFALDYEGIKLNEVSLPAGYKPHYKLLFF